MEATFRIEFLRKELHFQASMHENKFIGRMRFILYGNLFFSDMITVALPHVVNPSYPIRLNSYCQFRENTVISLLYKPKCTFSSGEYYFISYLIPLKTCRLRAIIFLNTAILLLFYMRQATPHLYLYLERFQIRYAYSKRGLRINILNIISSCQG